MTAAAPDRSGLAGPAPPGPAPEAPAPTPAAPTPCRACSAPLEPGKLFCARCGTPAPGAPACPHCGAVADVARHEEVRLVCKACGAPRIDVDRAGFELPASALDTLRRTERARVVRRRWRIAGAMGGLGAAGIIALALLVQLIFGFSIVGTTLAVLMALPLAIVAALSVARSARASAEVSRSLDEAWLAAARQLAAQSDKPLTTAELGRALRLSEPETERLAAELAVDQLVSTNVTADGELAFGSGMRIEPAAPAPGDRAGLAAADTVAAEAEAVAAAEAAQGTETGSVRAHGK